MNESVITSDGSDYLDFHEGDISSSSIIGTLSDTGLRVFGTTLNQVTLVNHDVAIVHLDEDFSQTINGSNIFCNQTFSIRNHTTQELNGSNNYYGAEDSVGIGELVYDYYNDITLGRVSIDGFKTEPNINCPIAPPKIIDVSESSGQYSISWHRNYESDVAGYKMHYGTFDGIHFQHSLDLGNDTVVVYSDSVLSEFVGITAYDNMIDGDDDMLDGNESWYGMLENPVVLNVKGEATKPRSECVTVFPNPSSTSFIIAQVCQPTENYVVQLIDLQGKLVLEYLSSEDEFSMDVSSLVQGVYFLKIELNTGVTYKKVIKN